MKLTINGEVREVPADVPGDLPRQPAADAPRQLTLSALLTHLELTAARVAVERNREIVPRDQWEATQIHDGDKLEIVHLVGGG